MNRFIKNDADILSKDVVEKLTGKSLHTEGPFCERGGTVYSLKKFRHGYHLNLPLLYTLSYKQTVRKNNVLGELRTFTTSDIGCIIVNGINFTNKFGDGHNKVIVRLVRDVWQPAFSVEDGNLNMLNAPSDLTINWYDCGNDTFCLKNACFLFPHAKCILIKTDDQSSFDKLKASIK
jgi:hypothetical protein